MPGTSLSPQAKVATLTLPTKDTRVAASVWPAAYGTILFLAEINLPAPTTQELLGKLTDKLENTWHSDKFYSLNNDQALEFIIAELNPILSERARLMGNPLAPRYQFILALYQAGNLALSSIGRLNTLLVSSEHVTNVLGLAPSKIRSATKPTFEFITTGQLKPGETLILSSSCLLDYFSTDKVRSLFYDNAPGAALRNIEQYVSSLPTHSPMGLLALKLTAADQITGTEPSLAKLIQTKDQTKNLLRPSMWHYLKEKAQGLNFKSPKTTEDPKEDKDRQFIEVSQAVKPTDLEKPEIKPRVKSHKIKKFYDNLNVQITNLITKLAWLKSRESIKQKITDTISDYLLNWQLFTTLKKVVALIGFLALLIFAGSIVRLGRASLAEQDYYNYTRLLAKITQEQSNIEAALIYKDDIKAKLGLVDLKKMIGQLPQTSTSQKDQATALLKSLAWLENRVARKTEITTLNTWATLTNQTDGWINLQAFGNNILAFGANGQVAYLNSDGKNYQSSPANTKINTLTRAVTLGKFILLTDKSDNQFWYEPNSKTLSPLSDPLKAQDSVFYEDKIYYLASDKKSIWRTSKFNNGFTKPVQWSKNNESLPNNPQAIGIDGSIYVAGDNLFKYTKGIKQNFIVSPLEPSLESVDRIFTTPTTDYLYLVNKSQKRLIIYDKKGRLVAQLSFSNLNINDMIIDPINRDAYLLSDSIIYKLNLIEYGS